MVHRKVEWEWKGHGVEGRAHYEGKSSGLEWPNELIPSRHLHRGRGRARFHSLQSTSRLMANPRSAITMKKRREKIEGRLIHPVMIVGE